jgi:hypothetical protein
MDESIQAVVEAASRVRSPATSPLAAMVQLVKLISCSATNEEPEWTIFT